MSDPITKTRKVLKDICDLNNYSRPVYKFKTKYQKIGHAHGYRKWYEVNVVIDGYAFSGNSVSKRMAKNFAAFEAIKRLRFKKCPKSAITELVGLCAQNNLSMPLFTEEIPNTITATVGLNFQDHILRLVGEGCDESSKMAKLIAAKDVLDQLIIILEYATIDPPPK